MPEGDPTRTVTNGQLPELPVVTPTSFRRAVTVARLIGRLSQFVDTHRLGLVVGPGALYGLPGGSKLGSDASFIAAERAATLLADSVFPQIAPDMVVQVLSQADGVRRVLGTVGEYLEAGVRLVWLLDPEKRQAAVYRSASSARGIGPYGILDGEDVLPGFRCAVWEMLG